MTHLPPGPATTRPLVPPVKEPLMQRSPEIAYVLAVFTLLRARVAGADSQRGDVMQWVLVTAIGVTLAVAVGAIIIGKVTEKANQISTSTP